MGSGHPILDSHSTRYECPEWGAHICIIYSVDEILTRENNVVLQFSELGQDFL